MIRERRPEDYAPLCHVLAELGWPPGVRTDADRLVWLQELRAERAWVFDAAPVTVAPTGNVIGHLQIVAPGEAQAQLVAATGLAANHLLVLTRLLVRPGGAGEEGIRRFLLRESIRFCRSRGRTAIVDLANSPGLTGSLCGRYGFTALALSATGDAAMILREKDE
ncbi:hypothetical protein [Ornithinimicrobium murale]|uniref:hypothetical protein n=1 Tax=Ornithinimicrobium murale TaxID=1050153 RepID=UPI0013B416CB|nr:hypothetical protein [Ornithinimicrobium murale]